MLSFKLPSFAFRALRGSSFSTSNCLTDFNSTSEKILQHLVHRIESSEASLPAKYARSFDCEYSQGVLTVRFCPQTCYVVNKQPPNSQIWLSSPFSGPRRFSFASREMKWLDVRDCSIELESLLEKEFSSKLNFKLINLSN